MAEMLNGRCFCGAMQYEIENSFDKMFFCSCDQCRQITGSAFASNLFTDSSKFRWIAGEEHLGRYDLPGRKLARTFCKICGSGVPKISLMARKSWCPLAAWRANRTFPSADAFSKPNAQIGTSITKPMRVLISFRTRPARRRKNRLRLLVIIYFIKMLSIPLQSTIDALRGGQNIS